MVLISLALEDGRKLTAKGFRPLAGIMVLIGRW